MAPNTAPVTPVAPQVMTLKPYDPMKTVDGMFKGSVMRMAYAFKDPKNFGESTKVIISECTKKYQDALDDCEVQILDAKWYLEQKLAENQARREAQAKEANAATAKRKHDEAAEKDREMNIDSPSKRTKGNEHSSPKIPPVAQTPSNTKDQPGITHARPVTVSPQSQQIRTESQPAKPQESEKAEEREVLTPQPPPPPQGQKQQLKQPPDPGSATDDFPKQTPNVTPAITNEDFTFESMFTDALGDGDGDNMDDLNIGLDDDPFGDSFGSTTIVNDTSTNTQPPTQTQDDAQLHKSTTQKSISNSNAPDNAFSSLLEGVEQFANQPDESQKSSANNANSNTFASDIDMGTNIFDSFLNDEFDVGSNHGGNDFGDFGTGEPEDVNFDELFGD